MATTKTRNHTCELCEEPFTRRGTQRYRFCSTKCYHEWRKNNNVTGGQFTPGHATWNKGMKGYHPNPGTSFKPGQEAHNKLPIGTCTTRVCKGGQKRAFIKISEPNIWILRALWVWENNHGALPGGMVIHHADKDALNDEIANLIAMTRSEHIFEHRDDIKRAKS